MSFRLHARVFYWNLVIIVIVVLIAQESGTRALAAIVVGILINLVLAWFIRVRISSPINEIATAIRKLAAGDLNHRLPISGEEEVVTLGTSLNAMAQNIGLMIGQLQEGKRKVESVVAAMSEGVIVLDRAGRITLTNESFRRLSGIDRDLTGRTILDVFRLPELEIAVRMSLVGEEPRTVEFTTGAGKVLEANVALVPNVVNNTDSVVVVFHDLTAIRRTEKMRRDFVANVSHEFKTPLTSIRGYTETLLAGSVSDKRAVMDFLRTIERNARHLETLVSDMLTLARLEAEVPALREPVNVKDVIVDHVSSRRNALAARDIRATVDCPDVQIRADRSRLAAAISNLIDNAIQYNTKGGEIRIAASVENGTFVLSIGDTGQGIPSQDLRRIFERFYRVDKARSRDSGGTGLGLAIVKHAIESQGGTVDVTSKMGSGTTFTIRLPSVNMRN